MNGNPSSCNSNVIDSDWIDDFLFAGQPTDICLRLPDPVDRGTLHRLVTEAQTRLAAAGLRRGGAVALRLPPSLAYVVNLLASWRSGAQAILLDHRLTDHEVERALARLTPQVVVAPVRTGGAALRVFVDVTEGVTPYADRPAVSGHAVVQLSSGSTGPSKVIGRTAEDLVAEVRRYTQIDGVALPGERLILLPSMVHVLGLVGGLLYGLHAGVELVPPQRLSGEAVLAAIGAADSPATVLGVPFHIGLLAATRFDRPLPMFTRMTTGGELVSAGQVRAFTDRFGVPLGNMYGMTEVGVIGTDLHGQHRPAIAPAPGIEVRDVDGELRVSCPASPYLGSTDPSRWSAGWLHTRDAGTVDRDSGLVTVRGRLDSQVSVGGMKVDLTEVEATVAELPGVAAAVVVWDDGITAYVQSVEPLAEETLDQQLAERLAGYKRPRTLRLLDQLPRTTTGKLVRSVDALRTAATS
ncbi:class I adenylate-forming enzyme family protein [Salinispora arenicola]|uniref:Acyl-CoA synthetase n=1 Tax=Salinispora arenicola TaxID=168697 RepID=A0A542XRP1_SALAC|nr:class I adenylate-forming enzyme family protein [Salinispora arenicola]MCN0150989.1 acyl--CoA ligase [Salinispora arenicola]NIL42249.1 acyl--CoA ligase [Salinispora arenicola]TQL38484.1 acyl-CoA synthetase (AMP-forming)/AMP-acid ligase II [Salinispora arenicola]GIM84530.1 acyl-CoA synthetase [Salinispora arenicola]